MLLFLLLYTYVLTLSFVYLFKLCTVVKYASFSLKSIKICWQQSDWHSEWLAESVRRCPCKDHFASSPEMDKCCCATLVKNRMRYCVFVSIKAKSNWFSLTHSVLVCLHYCIWFGVVLNRPIIMKTAVILWNKINTNTNIPISLVYINSSSCPPPRFSLARCYY